MNLFSCKNVTKQYPGGGFVLRDISLTLAASQITGVVGENGNGKTTLLRIIAGELGTDEGKISYFGENDIHALTWENIRSRIAYIPQRIPKWYGVLKANLIFQASIRGIKGKDADVLVDRLLEELGLEAYADLNWKEISTGYRLRFQLAKMLIGDPELLVLDEPIANLDINAQEKFLGDLRSIVSNPDRNVSVILSSQQLHEIENVSDSVVFLKKGRMLFAGNVDDIGKTREFNEFEIQTDLTAAVMEQILPNIQLKTVGKTTHVKAPLEMSAEQFISHIIKAEGKLQYFRDISSSTRKFFNN
jgi:ABC-2 type transport system ATP-binding protein